MSLALLRNKWLAPLIFFQLYLSIILMLFFLGPWPWPVESPGTLIIYLLAAQGFIAAGYFLAWRSVISSYNLSPKMQIKGQLRGVLFLKLTLIINLALIIPTSLSRTGEIFPDIIFGINNIGAAYNQNFARLEENNIYIFAEYLRIVSSPLLVGLYPLTIVYWSCLSGRLKFLCLMGIFLNLSMYIATGTNKGFADFLITLPWLIFLGVSTGVLRIKISLKILTFVFACLFIGFLIFFGKSQLQREGGVGELALFNTGAYLIEANASNFISIMLSGDLRIIYESLTRYLGQGYYALSMSFDIDHMTTFGFGNSIFLARNMDAIFNTTYFTWGSIPGLLEEKTGWGMFTLWHSIYPWLASDFGFIGALFIMALFSYIFALSWGRSLATLEFHWIILAYFSFIIFFYIPANNQIFQSGETCFAFLVFVVFGTLFRDNLYNIKNSRNNIL